METHTIHKESGIIKQNKILKESKDEGLIAPDFKTYTHLQISRHYNIGERIDNKIRPKRGIKDIHIGEENKTVFIHN